MADNKNRETEEGLLAHKTSSKLGGFHGSKPSRQNLNIFNLAVSLGAEIPQPTKMAKEESAPVDKCPVDPATREAWLKSNRSKPVFPGIPVDAVAAAAPAPSTSGPGCDSSTVDQTPSPALPQPPKAGGGGGWFSWLSSSSPSSSQPPSASRAPPSNSLGLDREVSSIPRASAVDVSNASKPANGEKESEVSEGGNWIYPSEKMFFEAMKRKGYESDVKDMKTIVPIHNAVNERAWKEIKEWERPWGSEKYALSFLLLSLPFFSLAYLTLFLN
ncbi:hypothetical protein B7463_g173, partial [Scytalidium lignicola]